LIRIRTDGSEINMEETSSGDIHLSILVTAVCIEQTRGGGVSKVKLSPLQAVEAYRVVRC
jgi:hypothetical protein